MKIQGLPRRSLESLPESRTVRILDQTRLPHAVEWRELGTVEQAAEAITVMRVRGAPLIGATAAFGYAFALREDPSDAGLASAYDRLFATRPTAVNLRWGLDRIRRAVRALPPPTRAEAAWREALAVAEDDVATNRELGRHGLAEFRAILGRKAARVGNPRLNLMTHCNAGWLACVDWGTALSPIYQAHDAGLDVHVWVSETRPRGQGAALTAWELLEHGVPHTLVVDNEAGHLLQRGWVDACIVGADRVTARGDVANKIGTYLKALAARAHDVPFLVAVPSSTMDWTLQDGVRDIPIEERAAREVTHVGGITDEGRHEEVRITPARTPARNDAFDVTPATLVSGLVTEFGTFTTAPTDLERLHRLSMG